MSEQVICYSFEVGKKKKKKVTLLNKEILFNILVPMRSELVDDTQNNVHRKGGEGRKKRKRIKKKRKKTE